MRSPSAVLAIALSAAAVCSAAECRGAGQYGITWTFDRAVPCGQFVNGDWWVAGEFTVVAIEPAPGGGRNGSVLNLTTDSGKTGFDSRLQSGRYIAAYDVFPPLALKPGDALVSSVSVDAVGRIPNMLRASDKAEVPIQTAAVLTVMPDAVPDDAFRPGYCDRKREKLRRASDLRRDLLPNLPLDGVRLEYDGGALSPEFAARLFQRPWLDTVTYNFASPMENMPMYGREVARAAGIGSLLLCSDFAPERKEPLLVNMVQAGIDFWSIVEAGKHPGWFAHGGHGNGRKWLIAFAGLMLGDDRMAAPSKTYPAAAFSEDTQAIHARGWTGAQAVYGGHYGFRGHPAYPDWGPYEHLHPSEWPGDIGESYRRCCTSVAWVGQALAARILQAEENWDHPAFFDYVDRWMSEDDADAVRIIKEARGRDYSAGWSRQGQAWDPFVQDMWAKYREGLPKAAGAGDRKGPKRTPPRTGPAR